MGSRTAKYKPVDPGGCKVRALNTRLLHQAWYIHFNNSLYKDYLTVFKNYMSKIMTLSVGYVIEYENLGGFAFLTKSLLCV